MCWGPSGRWRPTRSSSRAAEPRSAKAAGGVCRSPADSGSIRSTSPKRVGPPCRSRQPPRRRTRRGSTTTTRFGCSARRWGGSPTTVFRSTSPPRSRDCCASPPRPPEQLSTRPIRKPPCTCSARRPPMALRRCGIRHMPPGYARASRATSSRVTPGPSWTAAICRGGGTSSSGSCTRRSATGSRCANSPAPTA